MKKNFKLVVSKHAWQRQGEDFPACLLWKGNSGSIAHQRSSMESFYEEES